MQTCYGYRADTHIIFIETSNIVPCPSGRGCCFESDTCLSNDICLSESSSSNSANYSGYYIGSCTDPTFQSPDCPRQCTGQASFSVVYNYTTNLWACCSGDSVAGTVRCDLPTNETFSAPAPEKLATISGTTTSTSSTKTLTSSQTSAIATASTPSPTPPGAVVSSSGNTFSPGATAGIAIGTAIGVILLFIILAWFGFLRRRWSNISNQPYRVASSHDADKFFIHSWRGPRSAEVSADTSMSRFHELYPQSGHVPQSPSIYEAPQHGASRSGSRMSRGGASLYRPFDAHVTHVSKDHLRNEAGGGTKFGTVDAPLIEEMEMESETGTHTTWPRALRRVRSNDSRLHQTL